MRNALSSKIFGHNLSKTCYSEDFKHAITYKDLFKVTENVSAFINRLTNRNCRVGLYSQNDRFYALYALALMENAIYVPINPKLNETQLIDYLDMFKIDVLFSEETHIFEDARLATFPKWTFNDKHQLTGSIIQPKQISDFCILTTTSGTSDTPKRVPLYYESWVYSIDKYNTFFDFNSNVKQYVYVHLHRVASLYIILRTWMAHGEVIYHKDKNMITMIDSISKEDVSHLNGPPSLFNSLVQTLKLQDKSIKRIHKLQVHTSGSALNQTLMDDIRYYLDADVYNNYGLTEVYYIASTYKCEETNNLHNGQMIIDDYKLVENELWVKGKQVFRGYEGNEECFEGEWFKTGDIVEFDDKGYCHVSGRIKEFINRGGEKISPYQIEKLILKYFPQIKQCVVFPIPNTYGSDDVACAIVLDEAIELKMIRNRLLSEIEAYKCPTQLFQLTEIPMINDKLSRNNFYEIQIKEKVK